MPISQRAVGSRPIPSLLDARHRSGGGGDVLFRCGGRGGVMPLRVCASVPHGVFVFALRLGRVKLVGVGGSEPSSKEDGAADDGGANRMHISGGYRGSAGARLS